MAVIHAREVSDRVPVRSQIRTTPADQSPESLARRPPADEAPPLTPGTYTAEAGGIASRGTVTEDDILAVIEATRGARAA